MSASANVIVNVGVGNLVAIISGGSQQSLRIGGTLTIDWSKTYDEDQPDVTGDRLSNVTYTLSCKSTVANILN